MSQADPIEGLLEEAQALLPGAIELRRQIHRNPELGLELPETRASVLAALEGIDLDISLSETTSGVVATLRGRGGPGPTILLRGDMDALPMPEDTDVPFKSQRDGVMHACGHDSHVAMLVGAARLLENRRDELHGNVKLMFQPGEEGHAGARYMIHEGLLENSPSVDAAFAIHIFPLLPVGLVATRPGPLMASADTFSIQVRGKGGHASMPHDTLDPIPVACEIVQALQSFITRRINAFEPAVLTVAKIHSGTTTNVIPEHATIEGTIRAVSERTRLRVHEGLERIAAGIAGAHECSAETEIVVGYPVTVNNDAFARFALEVAGDLFGEARAVEQPNPAMGAEDFSFVLQKVPGAMAILGVRPDDATPAPCHSNRMVLNEAGMAHGIALHSAIALRYLDGEKHEFPHVPS